jgi:tRNA pseudouridine65 synthase
VFKIIYSDAFITVIDKPYDMLVHRTNIARQESVFVLQELRNQIGRHLYPVHRLDRPTSGVLLFAHDQEIARNLAAQFEERQVEKRYWLICRGYVPVQGEIDYPLVPKDDFQSKRKKQGLASREKSAQEAVTRYRCLQTYELDECVDKYPKTRYSLVEATPQTGRKHQIRRHFKHISHPIIGDARYGKSSHNRFFADKLGCDRLCLHAVELKIKHPITQESIVLQAPPSDQFLQVIQRLRYTDALYTDSPQGTPI